MSYPLQETWIPPSPKNVIVPEARWLSWALLSPGAMLMSEVREASENLVWVASSTVARDPVSGQYCCQKLCGGPCSVLRLIMKSKEATFAVISMTEDTQFRGTASVTTSTSTTSLTPKK